MQTAAMLEKLQGDQAAYHQVLKTEKDGTKCNPIQLKGVASAEAKTIGAYLIRQYQVWKPGAAEQPVKELGELYGFQLFIRHEKEQSFKDGGLFQSEYNTLYAQRPGSSIHYTASSGAPNTDNPKLAARYFLNAIDKVDGLVEKYTKDLADQQAQIPQLRGLLDKPFEQEKELIAMKSELNVLEKEIARKIREKQEAQQQEQAGVELPDEGVNPDTVFENPPLEEAIVVSLAGEQAYRAALKNETAEPPKIRKGVRV